MRIGGFSSQRMARRVGPLDQPYPRQSRADHRLHSTVPSIRRELVSYALPPDETLRPRSLPELTTSGCGSLPAAPSGLTGHPRGRATGAARRATRGRARVSGCDRERVFGLLAEAYYAVDQVLSKLGYADLASLAVDRYEWAAERSSDPLVVLIGITAAPVS